MQGLSWGFTESFEPLKVSNNYLARGTPICLCLGLPIDCYSLLLMEDIHFRTVGTCVGESPRSVELPSARLARDSLVFLSRSFPPRALRQRQACSRSRSAARQGESGGAGDQQALGGRSDLPLVVLWMDNNSAPCKKPWNADFPVNAHEHWFSMASKWCRISSIHSIYEIW